MLFYDATLRFKNKHEIKSSLYKFLFFFKKLPCRLKSATYILTALPHLQLHSIFSNLPLHYCKYVVNLSILGKPILSIHLLYGRSSWPNINISKPRIEQFLTASPCLYLLSVSVNFLYLKTGSDMMI